MARAFFREMCIRDSLSVRVRHGFRRLSTVLILGGFLRGNGVRSRHRLILAASQGQEDLLQGGGGGLELYQGNACLGKGKEEGLPGVRVGGVFQMNGDLCLLYTSSVESVTSVSPQYQWYSVSSSPSSFSTV